MNVPVEAAEIDLRATFPTASKYGLDPAGGAAMEKLTYVIDISSPAPRERVRELVETAERHCHASNSLRVPVAVEGTLRLNGEAVPFSPPAPPELG
ncbi:MAG: OsmC family protein [Solirubrobacterales bacterium]|nr:OsmC family protein [Solirubrobacterales bacterium]